VIGSAGLGGGFAGLAGYLVYGRGREDDGERGAAQGVERSGPGRVAWAETRNLQTRDPMVAAELMEATAERFEALGTHRLEKPVYHVSIAFHPDDRPTPLMLRDAADRLLKDLGLSEHEAVYVAHRDTAHPHVHLMVNRVHPETGAVWRNSKDYERIEVSLRQQEVELGVARVAGKHAAPPEIGAERDPERVAPPAAAPRRPAELDDADRAPRGPARTKGEVREGLRTGEATLVERVREQVAVFRESAGWEELTRRLAAQGLRLERKGQGLVVTDGVTAVKASRVSRDSAMAQLGARFGESYDAWAERTRAQARTRGGRAPERAPAGRDAGRRALTDLSPAGRYVVAAARDYARRLRVRAVVVTARGGLEAVRGSARVVAGDVARVEAAEAQVDAAVARAYRDPTEAARRVRAAAAAHGAAEVARALRTEPERFGALHGEPRPADALGRLRARLRFADAGAYAAREVARDAARGTAAALERWADARRFASEGPGVAPLAAREAQLAARLAAAEAGMARLPDPDTLARGLARALARLAPDERARVAGVLRPEEAGLVRAVEHALAQAAALRGDRAAGRGMGRDADARARTRGDWDRAGGARDVPSGGGGPSPTQGPLRGAKRLGRESVELGAAAVRRAFAALAPSEVRTALRAAQAVTSPRQAISRGIKDAVRRELYGQEHGHGR
jgi:hypothetical protein